MPWYGDESSSSTIEDNGPSQPVHDTIAQVETACAVNAICKSLPLAEIEFACLAFLLA